MADLLPPPFPISLILCDGIHTDPYTGRRTLLGEFDEFPSTVFPAVIPVCHTFAEVTECMDRVRLRLRVSTTDPEKEPVWETDLTEIASDSPLARTTVHWGVEDLTFPEPGVYLVQLVDGYDRVVTQRRLFITETTHPPDWGIDDEA